MSEHAGAGLPPPPGSPCQECGGMLFAGQVIHWDGCSKGSQCAFCNEAKPCPNVVFAQRPDLTTFTLLMCSDCAERPAEVKQAIMDALVNGRALPD